MTLHDVIKFDGVGAKVSHTGTRYKHWNRDSCYLTHEELPSLNTHMHMHTVSSFSRKTLNGSVMLLMYDSNHIPINILVSVCLHKCKQERSPICRDLMTRSLRYWTEGDGPWGNAAI